MFKPAQKSHKTERCLFERTNISHMSTERLLTSCRKHLQTDTFWRGCYQVLCRVPSLRRGAFSFLFHFYLFNLKLKIRDLFKMCGFKKWSRVEQVDLSTCCYNLGQDNLFLFDKINVFVHYPCFKLRKSPNLAGLHMMFLPFKMSLSEANKRSFKFSITQGHRSGHL